MASEARTTTPPVGPEPVDQRRDLAERSLRTCPNCGRELRQRACKLSCPDPACGFFLSCADYV